jgi:glycosyltransferase involved in cell wall biosynthesis
MPMSGRIVLAVVTSERRKNLGALLDAFAVLAVRDPDAGLVLIGALSNTQRGRCEHIRGSERLTVLTDVSVERLVSCYRAADCLAHLSFYEGFGYPLVEAMASGCPIVCALGGAVREVVGECAEYVASLQPEVVAAALAGVLSSTARQEELRARGYSRVEKFSSERPYVAALQRVWES